MTKSVMDLIDDLPTNLTDDLLPQRFISMQFLNSDAPSHTTYVNLPDINSPPFPYIPESYEHQITH